MRKSELGAWSGLWGRALALLLTSCTAEQPPAVAPRSVAPAPVGDAGSAMEPSAAPRDKQLERVLPVVPVAASLCDAVAAASPTPAGSEAARTMLAAEQAACAGRIGEAEERWERVATLEPRLADITNRRIAQASGGGRRGDAPARSLAGGLMGGGVDDRLLSSLKRTDAWLFALEPAPWIRSRLDAVRWRRVAASPETEDALAWARQWLVETDGGDASVWLERFAELRAHAAIKPADRLLLSGRCVDRFVEGQESPFTDAARRRLLPALERCLGPDPIADGLSGEGGVGWVVGEIAETDAVAAALAERESRWQELRRDRRSDLDSDALAIAELLGEQPGAWRGAEALLACVQLGESLGASERAERCLTALSAVETALVWDEGQRYEVALQRALRSPSVSSGMEALVATGAEAAGSRRRFVAARADGSPSPLRALIAEAPLSYEAVVADRLLRQDGGAGELASKLATLRFAAPNRSADDAGWAAEWLASQGFLSQARGEALLQAEVEGSQNPRLWGVAADLLARNGEFALAHSAARKLTASLGNFPEVTHSIPGRVWRDAYPMLWEKEVATASERQGVSRSLLLAFLRRESGFDADARSSVGARGLMQVLPETAREVAARHGISMARGLGDPELNLEIAAAMISDLMREFDGRVEVVAAAYSAGPAKARRWVRGHEGADLWLWTEAIPYDVVRSYAREVAVSAALYSAWLGESPPDPHTTLRSKR